MIKKLSVVGDWFDFPVYPESLAHAVRTHLCVYTFFKKIAQLCSCPNAKLISFGRVTQMSLGNEFVSVHALSDSRNSVKFPGALLGT